MSVGVQGEPSRVVTQGTGQRFHVHPAFQRQRGEGVSEIMEPDVLRADGLQNFVMGSAESIRVIHSSGLGGWKQIQVARVLFVLGNQQVDCLLWGASVRTELRVFGGLTTNSPLMRFTCFVTASVRFSMSKSVHWRANNSPLRRPVVSSK